MLELRKKTIKKPDTTATVWNSYTTDISKWYKWWQSHFPTDCQDYVLEITVSTKEYYEAAIKYHFFTKRVKELCSKQEWNHSIVLKQRVAVQIKDYVIEFQNDPISQIEFNERNWLYQKAGYKVIWVCNLINEAYEQRLQWYDEIGNGAKFRWTNPRKTFNSLLPQNYKRILTPESGNAVMLFFQLAEPQNNNIGYIERVIWAKLSDKKGTADYRLFITNYDICTAEELRQAVLTQSI